MATCCMTVRVVGLRVDGNAVLVGTATRRRKESDVDHEQTCYTKVKVISWKDGQTVLRTKDRHIKILSLA